MKRFDNGEVKPAYRLDQRWVKNNRDPENVVYGISGEGDTTLLYNEITFLLVMALADGALENIDSWDDIHQIKIPDGKDHVSLRWKDEALKLPVLRHVKKDGTVINEPMKRQEYEEIWRALLLGEGFLSRGGMHMVRRGLGKKLDGIYTEAIRSQHITQSDTRVYGRDYMANMSSANGKAAFLDLPLNHETVEHFQGLERCREEGLPSSIPAEREEAIHRSPEIMELQSELDDCVSASERMETKRKLANLLKRLKREDLKEYQKQWVRNRQSEIVLKRGHVEPLAESYEPHVLIQLVPERRKIAELASLKEGLTEGQLREAENALYSLCVKDLTTPYRPDEQPVDGNCPVCGITMASIQKRSRADHIHGCRRMQVSKTRGYNSRSLRYCYDCFKWFALGNHEWSRHCDIFHAELRPRSCDRITYNNTVVKEYRCGACAAPQTPEELRLKDYSPTNFWLHLQQHINKIQSWPVQCIYSGCTEQVASTEALQYHLKDTHYLAKRQSHAGVRGRKRARNEANGNDNLPSINHAQYCVGDESTEVGAFMGKNVEQNENHISDWSYPLTDTMRLGLLDSESVNSASHPSLDFNPDVLDPQLRLAQVKDPSRPLEQLQRRSPQAPVASDSCFSAPHSNHTQPMAQFLESSVHLELAGEGPATELTAVDKALACERSPNGFEPSTNIQLADDVYLVDELLARSKQWYLVKWNNWSHEHNTWLQAQDIDGELVRQYDQSGKKNDFGRLLQKRMRKGNAQYLMRWNYRPANEDSWLWEHEVEENLISDFNEQESGIQKPRKKRRTRRNY
ncbi:hypothetical protein CNYM01_12925 [Colletotrichum nymphaeae SA-01]|uniref:Chromo domain-containing protein n=1 Tax=Colletotrichum nymphaeae SA-01 TaxID=1460502 RepID=A0A135TRU2_9PEZI|nr:hypothetical protein CNYM01_12925 [Colletotrichum nymphaeae SA-01]